MKATKDAEALPSRLHRITAEPKDKLATKDVDLNATLLAQSAILVAGKSRLRPSVSFSPKGFA